MSSSRVTASTPALAALDSLFGGDSGANAGDGAVDPVDESLGGEVLVAPEPGPAVDPAAVAENRRRFAAAADAYRRSADTGKALPYVRRSQLYSLARVAGKEQEALALARSEAAKFLPGWCGVAD